MSPPPATDEGDGAAPPIETRAAHLFPCAQCGAALRFSPEDGALACDYCGHSQPVDSGGPFALADARRELDYAAALREAIAETEVETTRISRCRSCGAATSLPDRRTATNCAFCAAPLVTDPEEHRGFRPRALLPFLISESEARDALRRWLAGRWFAPGDLAASARAGRGMRGVYLPYWTFDADTASRYSGERGDVYHVDRWVTVMQKGKRRKVRRRVPKIRWRPSSGRVSRHFDDVLILASKSLPPSLSARLARGGAFDLDGLRPYAPGYVSGFEAESYGVDLEEGFAAARAAMDLTIRRDVRIAIGGDHQRVRHIDTQLSEVTFKHLLLPIWIAAYRYRGEPFRVIVNGRTGAVMGERPWSPWRLALAGLAAAAVLGAVFFLLAAAE
ncbi:MAG: TFIIB-type zinc finger domain-containing protein [Pseudomonadota bacterium]